jgi:monoamine oxidase
MATIKATIFLLLMVSALMADSVDDKIYDVVVVGGGVSGTYSAWRLSEKLHNIWLMESSNRIGGRLFSVALPEAPDLVAELGGMRFTDSMENVAGLLHYLKLTKVFFDLSSTENLTYVRRVRLNKDEKSKLPFNFKEDERNKTPSELMWMGIYKALPSLRNLKHEEIRDYLKTAQYKGKPIWQMGFWNLLLNELSIEAFHYIRDVGGYYSAVSNWNSYDAILAFSKYMSEVTFYKVKEGFDSLPKKMADLFMQNGGKLSKNTQVTAISLEHTGSDTLVKVLYESDGKTSSCLAKNVILALPKKALEMLEWDADFYSKSTLSNDMKRVMPQYTSKIFLWYDEAWWQKLGFNEGPSRTDLPLRQCYYFGKMANASKGLLMASYNDGMAVDFWQDFFPSASFDESADNFVDMGQYIKNHTLSKEALNAITSQLAELHGVDIPKSGAALFQNWDEEPFGCGWHYWNPNNQSWLIIPRIRKPLPAVNLYICGEAYSAGQGWVEGALNSAEKMLEEHFGLPRPAWINPDYDLGP